MNLDERVQTAILIKYYGELLTEKQKKILSMYVDNNLSLSEVSEELGISRQAVKDALDNSLQTLKSTEEKLKFIARDEKIKNVIENKTENEISIVAKLQIISLLEE